MGQRTIVVTSLLVLLTLVIVENAGVKHPMTWDRAPRAQEPSTQPISPSPQISVHGATPPQMKRLDVAVNRFSKAGLRLPDLDVWFSRDSANCAGAKGRFSTSTTPWRISICSDLDSVYEHELAHAWERANLADHTRGQFMKLRGHEHWSQKTIPWNQRGMEDVALIIQQGLGGLPLPPTLSREQCERLAAFQLLTGFPDPRLVRWKAVNGVAPLRGRDSILKDPSRAPICQLASGDRDSIQVQFEG